ncbi:hypothetical protein DFH06DRAFT_560586 [Mycena polygramma]|nr:hypothetical protein DFH06DRAFT_560586 [Mycena polygramma]
MDWTRNVACRYLRCSIMVFIERGAQAFVIYWYFLRSSPAVANGPYSSFSMNAQPCILLLSRSAKGNRLSWPTHRTPPYPFTSTRPPTTPSPFLFSRPTSYFVLALAFSFSSSKTSRFVLPGDVNSVPVTSESSSIPRLGARWMGSGNSDDDMVFVIDEAFVIYEPCRISSSARPLNPSGMPCLLVAARLHTFPHAALIAQRRQRAPANHYSVTAPLAVSLVRHGHGYPSHPGRSSDPVDVVRLQVCRTPRAHALRFSLPGVRVRPREAPRCGPHREGEHCVWRLGSAAAGSTGPLCYVDPSGRGALEQGYRQ